MLDWQTGREGVEVVEEEIPLEKACLSSYLRQQVIEKKKKQINHQGIDHS